MGMLRRGVPGGLSSLLFMALNLVRLSRHPRSPGQHDVLYLIAREKCR